MFSMFGQTGAVIWRAPSRARECRTAVQHFLACVSLFMACCDIQKFTSSSSSSSSSSFNLPKWTCHNFNFIIKSNAEGTTRQRHWEASKIIWCSIIRLPNSESRVSDQVIAAKLHAIVTLNHDKFLYISVRKFMSPPTFLLNRDLRSGLNPGAGPKRAVCVVVVQCEMCLKTFARPCLLRSHARLAHPADSTIEVFKCTESGCSRTYASIRSLRRHVTLLHQGLVVECPLCHRFLSTKVSVSPPR